MNTDITKGKEKSMETKFPTLLLLEEICILIFYMQE